MIELNINKMQFITGGICNCYCKNLHNKAQITQALPQDDYSKCFAYCRSLRPDPWEVFVNNQDNQSCKNPR